jgi:hypothetical protein
VGRGAEGGGSCVSALSDLLRDSGGYACLGWVEVSQEVGQVRLREGTAVCLQLCHLCPVSSTEAP